MNKYRYNYILYINEPMEELILTHMDKITNTTHTIGRTVKELAIEELGKDSDEYKIFMYHCGKLLGYNDDINNLVKDIDKDTIDKTIERLRVDNVKIYDYTSFIIKILENSSKIPLNVKSKCLVNLEYHEDKVIMRAKIDAYNTTIFLNFKLIESLTKGQNVYICTTFNSLATICEFDKFKDSIRKAAEEIISKFEELPKEMKIKTFEFESTFEFDFLV